MKLILTGATGVAGLNIYRAALEDPAVSAVTLLMRRQMPSWAILPANASEKTTTILHDDFTTYPPELATRLAGHDACIWAMGKSVRGMSEEEYTLLTHDYPMAMLQALRDAGADQGRTVDKPFRFLYFSGEHADETEKSWQMWARVKGRTENDITKFCGSGSGFKAHILRPGYFRPLRSYPGDWANQRTSTESMLDCVLGPAFTTLLPSSVIPVDTLGRVAVEIAKGRWPELQMFRNQKMLELAKTL